jgi:hypothetical protein
MFVHTKRQIIEDKISDDAILAVAGRFFRRGKLFAQSTE